MKEMSVEEIVARLEREINLRGQATLLARDFRALIADWRKRGEARVPIPLGGQHAIIDENYKSLQQGVFHGKKSDPT